VKKDLVHLGSHQEWALDQVRWRGLMCRDPIQPSIRAGMDNGC